MGPAVRQPFSTAWTALLGAALVGASAVAGQRTGGRHLQGVPFYTRLRRIGASGAWSSPFTPERTHYNITLQPESATVALELDVDYSRYAAGELPIVSVDGKPQAYGPPSPITTAVHIKASATRSALKDVVVNVSDPRPHASAETLYYLHFKLLPNLVEFLQPTALSVEDDRGHGVSLHPAFDAALPLAEYRAHMPSRSRRARVFVACRGEATAELTFEGRTTSGKGNASAWVSFPPQAPLVAVRGTCAYEGSRRTVELALAARVDFSGVALQLRALTTGVAEVASVDENTFIVTCSQPTVELVPTYEDARLPLEFVVPGEGNYSSGSGLRTPPLRVPRHGERRVMFAMVEAGTERVWNVVLKRYAAPAPAPQPRQRRWPLGFAIGFAVAGAVAMCLAITAAASAFAVACGIGAPVHGSGVLRSLLLLLQFTSLNNVIEEERYQLSEFTDALQPLSLFPWAAHPGSRGGTALHVGAFWQASACLGRVAALAVAVAGAHAAYLVHRAARTCGHTVPHGLSFGAWEAQCLPHVAYPLSCAALVLLGQPAHWRLPAALALASPAVAAAVAAVAVARALSQGDVMWVSERGPGGKRQRGALEAGRFCDAMCDQLGTRPAERSPCAGWLLSLRWSATVADIREVDLCDLVPPEGLESRHSDDWGNPFQDDLGSPTSSSVPAGRPAVVEVVSTLDPRSHTAGAYAEAGHFAEVPWLEAALDSVSLLRLHNEVGPHLHNWATPLRVQVAQLQGPITAGRLAFCFDGLRWPLLPPLELALRAALGCCSAVTVTDPGRRVPALATAAGLAACLFAVSFFYAPFACFAENALLLLAHLGLALVALSYLGYAAGAFGPGTCSSLVMLSVGGAGVPLLLFAALRALALLSAVSCPCGDADEEADSTQACNVDLVLRGPGDAWLLVTPALCRVPVRTAFVHAFPDGGGVRAETHVSEEQFVQGLRARLEFPVLDYLEVKDKLEPPLAILFGPGAGGPGALPHHAEAIYPDEDPRAITAEFMRRSFGGGGSSEEAAAEVLEVLRARVREGHILSVGVAAVPPEARGRDGSSSGGEEEALLPSWRRTWRSPGARDE